MEFPAPARGAELGALVPGAVRHALSTGSSIDNGRSLLAWDDIIKINMPRVFSQFYEDAIMSERPVVTGTEAVIAWLAENGMQVWERIGRAVQQWSIFGLGVLVSYQDGTLRHIGSRITSALETLWTTTYRWATASGIRSINPTVPRA